MNQAGRVVIGVLIFLLAVVGSRYLLVYVLDVMSPNVHSLLLGAIGVISSIVALNRLD